jgi:arginase family enzyme
MDLNDYFEPVALDKPSEKVKQSGAMFGRHITIHTPSRPIDEISQYQLAILGVCEGRNSFSPGAAQAPNHIRLKLYELFPSNDKLRIIDLGNLRPTQSADDTYYGLRDVMMHLLNNQVTALVLGGTGDLARGLFMGYEQSFSCSSMVSIDSRLDMDQGPLHAASWMLPVMESAKLFKFTHLGHQQYLVDKAYSDELENRGFDQVRLGAIRQSPLAAEPYLRDAQLVIFDMSAIKQADAPGASLPSPNGLTAEEACQLARFAGLSEQVTCFGLFEMNPQDDIQGQTAHLAAQTLWHFIDGFSQRRKEKPGQNPDFKVYMVNHRDMEHTLTFYKSLVTDRWWMEVPDLKNGIPIMIACSVEEYQQACNHDIPELWWKAFQRIN